MVEVTEETPAQPLKETRTQEDKNVFSFAVESISKVTQIPGVVKVEASAAFTQAEKEFRTSIGTIRRDYQIPENQDDKEYPLLHDPDLLTNEVLRRRRLNEVAFPFREKFELQNVDIKARTRYYTMGTMLEALGMLPEGVSADNFAETVNSAETIECQATEYDAQRRAAEGARRIGILSQLSGDTFIGAYVVGLSNQTEGLSTAFRIEYWSKNGDEQPRTLPTQDTIEVSIDKGRLVEIAQREMEDQKITAEQVIKRLKANDHTTAETALRDARLLSTGETVAEGDGKAKHDAAVRAIELVEKHALDILMASNHSAEKDSGDNTALLTARAEGASTALVTGMLTDLSSYTNATPGTPEYAQETQRLETVLNSIGVGPDKTQTLNDAMYASFITGVALTTALRDGNISARNTSLKQTLSGLKRLVGDRVDHSKAVALAKDVLLKSAESVAGTSLEPNLKVMGLGA